MSFSKAKALHARIPPEKWCVTADDLDIFVDQVRDAHQRGVIRNDANPRTGRASGFHDNMSTGPNMHVVNRYFIIPTTRDAGGMSWALMCRPDGVSAEWFVTHTWVEGVYEFHRKLKEHLEVAGQGNKAMWICFLANPQCWGRDDLSGLIGSNVFSSPFARALMSSQKVVVVQAREECLYTRLWCVAEAYLALKNGIEVQHVVDESAELVQMFTTVHDAKCSEAQDERAIRTTIRGREAEIDRMIRNMGASTGRGAITMCPSSSGNGMDMRVIGNVTISGDITITGTLTIG
eukprot:TRINITY_DN35119_c0_g1_i1.p1 TRINITY_DN35119_c0_g1~~TRINITY_DN35119_c0_g1_i1.p1  ORF type:complete len:291 (+),score=40.21 TRINITY_DN35119_c0_g1_i1:156-1028(+)